MDFYSLVEVDPDDLKIELQKDIFIADYWLGKGKTLADLRSGIFVEGDRKRGIHVFWSGPRNVTNIKVYKDLHGNELELDLDRDNPLLDFLLIENGSLILQESWHDNGVKLSRNEYRNGEKCGEEVYWYPSGVMEQRKHYKDGDEEGVQEGWYPNGNKSYRHTFKAYVKVGLSETWHSDGQPSFRMYFNESGYQDGPNRVWEIDGTPDLESFEVGYFIDGDKIL